MLNLRFMFDDAITGVDSFYHKLAIPSLPAAVFLMQEDVIHRYRHGLTHYLTEPLTSTAVENSRLGSPHSKWVSVVNGNWRVISFAVWNLLHFSVRLFHETRYHGMRLHPPSGNLRSVMYESPLMEMKSGSEIGIVAKSDDELEIHSIRIDPPSQRVGCRADYSKSYDVTYFRLDESFTPPREVIIEKAEYAKITASIQTEAVSIADRSSLSLIQHRGLAEVGWLEELHERFGEVCRARLKRTDPYGRFKKGSSEIFQGYFIE